MLRQQDTEDGIISVLQQMQDNSVETTIETLSIVVEMGKINRPKVKKQIYEKAFQDLRPDQKEEMKRQYEKAQKLSE